MTSQHIALLQIFVVAAMVIGIAQAWTRPGMAPYGKFIEQAELAQRLFITFVLLWLGWSMMLAFYVIVPWIRG